MPSDLRWTHIESKRKGAGMNLNSILIGSENPQRLKDYYTKLFGDPTWDDGGYFGWRLGSGAVTVGPHDQVKGQNREPGRIIWNIETPDVQSEFKKLKAAGATVVKEPYDPGEGSADSQWTPRRTRRLSEWEPRRDRREEIAPGVLPDDFTVDGRPSALSQ